MAMLGKPAMPWQEHAADVIGALREDGRPKYSTVIVTVPRQSGKSCMMAGAAVHRMLAIPGAKVWLTAQTGQDAHDLWTECVKLIEESPYSSIFRSRKSNGSQCLTCTVNGSEFRPHPPTAEKLHGKQSDLNILDEAWAWNERQARAIIQAITPTHNTRPLAQTIIVSTMGDDLSTWLHGRIDEARLDGSRTALLDWGIEDGVDPTDLDAITAAHPAYGHTIDREAIENALEDFKSDIDGFARAYGNRRSAATSRIIPQSRWELTQSDETIPAEAKVSLGVAVDRLRTETSIAAAWKGPIDVVYGEIIATRPGTRWAPEAIKKLMERWDLGPPMIDSGGPAGALYDELDREKIGVQPLSARELSAACGEFFDRATASPPELRILPSDDLNTAAARAEKRPIGEGWAWSRKGLSVAPLEALTLAMRAATHPVDKLPAPAILIGIDE